MLILIVAFVLSLTQSVLAIAEAETPRHVIDGNEWLHMPEGPQVSFVVGALEAWTQAVLMMELGHEALKRQGVDAPLSSPETMYKNIVYCITQRQNSYSQLHSMVKKYVDDHPQDWDSLMSVLVISAFRAICNEGH